ncbi:PAS domain S-box protein, partial [Acinetobacter baumannii]
FDVFITPALYNEFESRRWTYVRKDGSTFPIQLVVTSIVNSNHQVIGFLGIGTDITNEEMARSLQQDLAIKLQNRNNQLLNFAHITSHNLRSPVSNLVTLLDLLEKAHTPEEKDILITKFDTVIKRLAGTLNDLIEALRIQEDISKEKE